MVDEKFNKALRIFDFIFHMKNNIGGITQNENFIEFRRPRLRPFDTIYHTKILVKVKMKEQTDV